MKHTITTITLRDIGDDRPLAIRLRLLLKFCLRWLNLRCIDVRQTPAGEGEKR